MIDGATAAFASVDIAVSITLGVAGKLAVVVVVAVGLMVGSLKDFRQRGHIRNRQHDARKLVGHWLQLW